MILSFDEFKKQCGRVGVTEGLYGFREVEIASYTARPKNRNMGVIKLIGYHEKENQSRWQILMRFTTGYDDEWTVTCKGPSLEECINEASNRFQALTRAATLALSNLSLALMFPADG